MRIINSITILVLGFASAAYSAFPTDIPQRNMELTYITTVSDIPEDTEELRLWMPIPQDNTHQIITELEINSPYKFSVSETEPYGNKVLFIEAADPPKNLEISVKFNVTRYANTEQLRSNEELDSSYTLANQSMVPISDAAKVIALAYTEESDDTMSKARGLYDHTFDHLTYDKSGEGWGRGDFAYACDVGRGNCTDFHSYFIGLARNIGIPAYFEIGVSIPEERGEGKAGGYHCWAYFNDGNEWIPVDISEADKHPDKKEYFFGNHDENRVAFSRGRDLMLIPGQKGAPLNFFINPYVEIDGKPYDGVSKEVVFRDI